MTKAERLIFLVNMIRNRGCVLVSEMARECGVSQRTIYRDINSLFKLNFPLYYDKGYRLVRDTGFPAASLDAEELELISYSLHFNPLAEHPFFKKKFKIINQKLLSRYKNRSNSGKNRFFLFEQQQDAQTQKSHDTDIIARFIKAIHERRKVYLTLDSSYPPEAPLIPLAVKLKHEDPILIVANDSKSISEIPIQNVTTVRLSNEKFTQRLLHLYQRDFLMKKPVDKR